jgi:hypothetical protein
MAHIAINNDNKTGCAEYMDQSAKFIRHVAGSSWAEYADELRDAANELKQEIIARISDAGKRIENLEAALDKLIERRLEDFELNFVEGKEGMHTTINNTVNIINSEISNSVLQITQSGKDAISKDTAQKLEQLVKSKEIEGLPEQTRLDVLDQVTDLIEELKAPTTDKGKVHRGLKRLGDFLSQVASSSIAETVAQAAIAYATFYGMLPT